MSVSVSATSSSLQANSMRNATQVSAQSSRQCGPDTGASTSASAVNEQTGSGSTRQAGLLGAIANALQELGADVLSNAESAQDADTDNTNDTAANEGNAANAAQALGEFLQNLMAALQKEGGARRTQGNRPPPPPPMDCGSGGLAQDLQKLIADLSGQATAASVDASNTTEVATADTSASAAADSATNTTAALSNSFNDLLNALGLSSENSQQKLESFLQNMLSQLSQNGRQGNFINTSA